MSLTGRANPLSWMRQILLGLGVALALAGCIVEPVVVRRPLPPPPPRVEVIPVQPGAPYVWVPGHWAWRHGGYVWLPGYWAVPAQPAYVWVPGAWVPRGGGWVERHWRGR